MYRVFEALDELVAIVEEARSVPMTASCVVPRGDVLELLDDVRDALPPELDDAQDVLDHRDKLIDDARAQADKTVGDADEEARALLEGDGVPSYEVETRTGKPAEQLVRRAEESSVVVMGSRGHSTLSDLVVGSVSQHVARQSPRPVVVVREQAQAQATRVVVGTDGSEGSRPALEWAFAYAEAVGVELTVVYGFQTSASSPAILSGFIPTNVGDEIAVAEDMLKDVVAPYAARFPGVAVKREAITVPASVALAEASETAALVVVGSRGRGAFGDSGDRAPDLVTHELIRAARSDRRYLASSSRPGARAASGAFAPTRTRA